LALGDWLVSLPRSRAFSRPRSSLSFSHSLPPPPPLLLLPSLNSTVVRRKSEQSVACTAMARLGEGAWSSRKRYLKLGA
jgi:hypothetical protein